MQNFLFYQQLITEEINKISLPEKPNLLYDPISYTLQSTGKRLRPALTLMGCNLYNKTIQEAIKPALAIEIFHNFTLLHDDIMDNSSIRRNKKTAHVKWNKNIALLSGDAMLILAYTYFSELNPEKLKLVLTIFNTMAMQVCEGQQFDMDFETRNDVTIEEYLEMVRLKTSVLLAASLQIGSIIGGATKEEAKLLYDYAQNIGLAFQVQDDLLDSYGDTKVFGKKIGNDIITNKKTFLLIKALELANGQTYEKLINLISAINIESSNKIKKVISIYNELNVKKITLEKINYHFEKAKNILDKLNLTDAKKQHLQTFANLLINRAF